MPITTDSATDSGLKQRLKELDDAFIECLRPQTIVGRFVRTVTDRRIARRIARRSGYRFTISQTRPREYRFADLVFRVPFHVRVM